MTLEQAKQWLTALYKYNHCPVWLTGERLNGTWTNCINTRIEDTALLLRVNQLTQGAADKILMRVEGPAEIYASFSCVLDSAPCQALVGPVLIAGGERIARELTIYNYLPAELALDFIASLPSIRALSFPDLVALVYLTLTGKSYDAEALYQEFFRKENANRRRADAPEETKQERLGYRKELEMLMMMKNGDVEALRRDVMSLRSRSVGYLSKDPFRQRLYEVVCMVTLNTRFAIEGGLDEETAYERSDRFIREADECRTISELEQLAFRMLDTMIHLVAESKSDSGYSPAVKRALQFIQINYRDRVLLTDMARYCNLSSHYLCSLFEKETGKTVSRCVLEKKIGEAKNLLRFSDMSYVDIAMALSFSSHSYFSAVFKKETGQSPRQYRSNRLDRYWS